jgi:hypothetical protein
MIKNWNESYLEQNEFANKLRKAIKDKSCVEFDIVINQIHDQFGKEAADGVRTTYKPVLDHVIRADNDDEEEHEEWDDDTEPQVVTLYTQDQYGRPNIYLERCGSWIAVVQNMTNTYFEDTMVFTEEAAEAMARDMLWGYWNDDASDYEYRLDDAIKEAYRPEFDGVMAEIRTKYGPWVADAVEEDYEPQIAAAEKKAAEDEE